MATQTLELAPKKPNGSEMIAASTPMDLLTLAINQDLSIDKLAQLLALQKDWEANEARKAFEAAKAAFKAESIHITRDKENKQYNSRYTSIGNLIETVTPFLSKHGLSADWDVHQDGGKIKVTCNLSHRLGHCKSHSLEVPPDNSGQKNPIQQIKSAITYARICTFECATGLASRDPGVNPDDDGNGSGPGKGMAEERFVELQDWISGSNTDEELKNAYLQACKEADQAGDSEAKRQFNQLKNKRYRELHDANHA